MGFRCQDPGSSQGSGDTRVGGGASTRAGVSGLLHTFCLEQLLCPVSMRTDCCSTDLVGGEGRLPGFGATCWSFRAAPALTCGCGGRVCWADGRWHTGSSWRFSSHVKRGRGGDSPAFVIPYHLERNPCGLEGEFPQSSGVSGFRDPSMRFSILALEL